MLLSYSMSVKITFYCLISNKFVYLLNIILQRNFISKPYSSFEYEEFFYHNINYVHGRRAALGART
jgi:hypothetical protein